jgi:predicted acylesterase/phospholipase RssA
MAAAAATVTARRLVTPSFGFSGAGFLTCYHLGVADCLLKHGLLFSKEKNNNVLLTGVSGGALVAATVSMGIPPEEGMTATLEIARRTRQAGGMLDHLLPGYVALLSTPTP